MDELRFLSPAIKALAAKYARASSKEEQILETYKWLDGILHALKSDALKYVYITALIFCQKLKDEGLGYLTGALIGNHPEVWKRFGHVPNLAASVDAPELQALLQKACPNAGELDHESMEETE